MCGRTVLALSGVMGFVAAVKTGDPNQTAETSPGSSPEIGRAGFNGGYGSSVRVRARLADWPAMATERKAGRKPETGRRA